MIASQPVRLISLAIVGLVVLVGVRAIAGGIGSGGDLLEDTDGAEASAVGTRTSGVVALVLDGDTVEVTTRGGRVVRVRFLGISAPEIPHPGQPGECYGVASTRHLRQLLPVGTQVTLVVDLTQDDVDTYGRWLRYVEAGGRDIGRAQVRAGAAGARVSADPVARHGTYTQAEEQARDSAAGMWTACP